MTCDEKGLTNIFRKMKLYLQLRTGLAIDLNTMVSPLN
jgi:hypothetical protein